ncbi:MAG: QueT transporter family protein [Bacteroides sp.]|nr:QueT transporter family protein [Eubacterium sp.]MCM1418466.1 QueT transporter family protein [Roseburia sp.]MCM1462062.1 QueT transporter family protein [Bacteroides sp.]
MQANTNNNRNGKALFLVQAALIAALYVVFTYLAALLGLSSGTIQIRFSEALTILPYFTPAAISGLFVGCVIANLTTGAILWDVVFGSIATLIGAVGTYLLRRRSKWLSPLPPILANTLIVPFVLTYAYGVPDGVPFLMLTVGAGEVISCGFLGLALLKSLEKYRARLFER